MTFEIAAVRGEIASSGELRVAINSGNHVLAHRDETTGNLGGVSVALAHALAHELGIVAKLTSYDAAGKVFAALEDELLNLAFLAIEPVRAEKIAFSEPYVSIDGTYLVREECPFQNASDLDTHGHRISVGRGAAYDLYLSRTLKHAKLVRGETSASAVDLFLEQGLEAAAGVRQPLERVAKLSQGLRVLADNFTEIRQAMAVPKARRTAAAYVQYFVNRRVSDGFVANALAESEEHDARVAVPKAY